MHTFTSRFFAISSLLLLFVCLAFMSGTVFAQSAQKSALRQYNAGQVKQISDLPPGHLSYPAAALAVTSGVMPALEGNTFQLSRVVTGAEAIAAVERIEKLTTSR